MTVRILVILALSAVTVAAAGDADGFLPAGARLVPLATLPVAPAGASARTAVRLAASGRPMALYRGRLVALAEQPARDLADWTPPADPEPVRDFCWLDDKTLVLLRGSGLDFFRDGKPVRAIALPRRGLRLARADAAHCYLFGGPRGSSNRDVLLFGVDGSVRNLFQAPAAVTAVAGDGRVTFVAAGPVIYAVSRGAQPRAVFRERLPITQLAYAPPAGVFYVTADGAGCMDAPGSGVIFLRRDIASLDSRGGRLLLMTRDREVMLISPIAGFPRVIKGARQAIAGLQPMEHDSRAAEAAPDGSEPGS